MQERSKPTQKNDITTLNLFFIWVFEEIKKREEDSNLLSSSFFSEEGKVGVNHLGFVLIYFLRSIQKPRIIGAHVSCAEPSRIDKRDNPEPLF